MVDFVPYEGNPVFAGTGTDTWDRVIRERGFILREGNTYHMWDTGYADRTTCMMGAREVVISPQRVVGLFVGLIMGAPADAGLCRNRGPEPIEAQVDLHLLFPDDSTIEDSKLGHTVVDGPGDAIKFWRSDESYPDSLTLTTAVRTIVGLKGLTQFLSSGDQLCRLKLFRRLYLLSTEKSSRTRGGHRSKWSIPPPVR